MTHARFSIPFVAVVMLCAAVTQMGFTCGNGDVVIGDVDGGADASMGTCTQSSQCSGGQLCGFPVGQCAATGTCVTPTPTDAGADCATSVEACGCDGGAVSVACNLPSGYASQSVEALGACAVGD